MSHFDAFLIVWNLFIVLYNVNMIAQLIYDLVQHRKCKKMGGLNLGLLTDIQVARAQEDFGRESIYLGQWKKKFAWRVIKIPHADDPRATFLSWRNIFMSHLCYMRTYYEREVIREITLHMVQRGFKEYGIQRAKTFFDVLKK